MALSPDAQQLLTVLPPTGRITNQTAMKITGWDMQRVLTAKFELRSADLVEIKRAWGGPFGKAPAKVIIPTTSPVLRAAQESDLYEPLKKWIEAEYVPDDFDSEKDLFEVLISASKRPPSAGPWEVPDIISLSIKKYSYVPLIQMEVRSFEVKKAADALNPYGIFEAISHSKFVHYSYYCFEWLDEPLEERADYQRLIQEASLHGIGLLRCRTVDDQKSSLGVIELLEPRQGQPQPNAVNMFIDIYFDDKAKKRIVRRTGHL